MKKYYYTLMMAMLAVILSAQQPGTVEELRDLAYLEAGEVSVDSLQRLHLLLPKGIESPPLLIWIGGGAWSFVDRNMELDLCRKLAAKGIAVASVGHRLSKGSFSEKRHAEGVKHPEHIKDVSAAFAWLYKNADKYGYARQAIYVGGYSSGAHLAALLGMDGRYLKKYGMETNCIKGLLPVSGTYDIHHYYQAFAGSENSGTRELTKTHVEDVFGPPEIFTDASPASYIDNLKAPLKLITDGSLANYTRHFETQLKKAGFQDFTVDYLSEFDHGGLWKNMSYEEDSKARDMMVSFIKEQQKKD